jgi:hypothetical protein
MPARRRICNIRLSSGPARVNSRVDAIESRTGAFLDVASGRFGRLGGLVASLLCGAAGHPVRAESVARIVIRVRLLFVTTVIYGQNARGFESLRLPMNRTRLRRGVQHDLQVVARGAAAQVVRQRGRRLPQPGSR